MRRRGEYRYDRARGRDVELGGGKRAVAKAMGALATDGDSFEMEEDVDDDVVTCGGSEEEITGAISMVCKCTGA